MANYPYASNPARVKEFFQKIQELGVPPKVTTMYLESLGYKSKNDRAILTVLRGIGFVDASGAPTDAWKKYRNTDVAPSVMATALKENYRDLFNTYPDAYRRDNEALRNFFSTHTSVGEGGLRFIVGTFKALAELAKFDGESVRVRTQNPAVSNADVPVHVERTASRQSSSAGSVVLNINIQLQIPETEKAEVYDRFFEAMKKHLLS